MAAHGHCGARDGRNVRAPPDRGRSLLPCDRGRRLSPLQTNLSEITLGARVGRDAQFLDGLYLKLAHALARQAQFLTDLFQ